MATETKKKKLYIDSDVYTEAKKRIRHVINTFDTLLVAFSGGKDSLCVLELVEEVYRDMGITEKVKVFFRDEELIPDDVIDFVRSKAESGRYDFRYYAIPLQSSKFILGNTYDYVQWDKDREWLRQPPEYAIRLPEGQYEVFDQYSADEFICQNEKGRVAILTGIRADESLTRLQSCCVKRNENYINATKSKRIKLVKPIYDWTERDLFVYFCKNDIKYCDIYDHQLWNGQQLRVATPLHAECSKQFAKQKTLYPKFYEQLITLFPEMIVQGMYWKEYDRTGIIYEYEHSFEGIHKYIDDVITDAEQNAMAHKRVKNAEIIRKNKMKYDEGIENFGGYPVLYVFKAVLAGQYKRELMPKKVPSPEDIEYENEGSED